MRAPSLADIQRLAEESIGSIPKRLRAAAGNVAVQVVDFPDEETEAEMGLESPFDLLGLYVGVAMTARSVSHPRGEPDMVYLYRRPILDYWCETGESLSAMC